ncbi:MAG: hypothetical protein AB9846_14040 [Tenuifilaceae bacterium]
MTKNDTMKVLVTFLVLSFLISCNSEEGVEITWRDYQIVGKVKMLSEKTIFAKVSKDLTESLDTILSKHTLIQNRYFNNKGLITEFNYFDKDSLLTLRNVYKISNGRIIGAKEYKKGKLTEKVEINKISENIFEAKTTNIESNEIISTSYTHRKDGFTYKQISESKLSGRIHKNNKYYIRNETGLITEIIDTIRIDNQLFTNKTLVKYFEFDQRNNWTKKIEYPSDSICRITFRKCDYY